MSPKARTGVAIAWRVLLALAGFVVTVMLTGDENKVFDLSRKTLFYGSVTVAALTFVDGVLGTIRLAREPGKSAAQTRVQKALVALLVQISETNSVGIQHLGASVFKPQIRFIPWRWHLKRPARVLVRVMRFRLDDHPQPTPVTWRKGKGAVGSCWKTARAVHRDWHEQARDWSAPELTQDTFDQVMRPDLRDNFEYSEYVAIAAKYSEVLAVPVLSAGGDVVGVISIDVAARAGVTNTILGASDTEAQADAAATLVQDDLDRLYAQS